MKNFAISFLSFPLLRLPHIIYLPQVLSVTFVKAGTALNVIPSYVKFGGTLRSQTTEGMYHFRQRIKEV